MASFPYNVGAKPFIDNAIIGSALTLKVRLVMTNTTVDTENDGKDHLNDFTTMDTHDGSGYVDKSLASLATAQDDTNNRTTLDCADITWTALGAGTRSIEGAIVYQEDSAAESGRIPIAFYDTTNIASNGGDVTLTINVAGFLAFAASGAP